MQHLEPYGWNGVEMMGMVTVINSVIELDSLVPVLLVGESVEAVIARCFCRELDISVVAFSKVD